MFSVTQKEDILYEMFGVMNTENSIIWMVSGG